MNPLLNMTAFLFKLGGNSYGFVADENYKGNLSRLLLMYERDLLLVGAYGSWYRICTNI